MSLHQKLSELNHLDDYREREQKTIEWFNEAIEQKDHECAREIADYVISQNDMRNPIFSYNWQLHCLNWLTGYYDNLCRQKDDNDHEFHQLLECLWEYKWLVGALPNDLNASKEDITAALNMMTELYDVFEFSPAMVHKAACEQAMYMGEVEAAKTAFAQWQAAESDDSNDCDACEQSSLVRYYHFIGDYARAVELAEPLLNFELTCGEVPHVCYFAAIDSMIQLGQLDQARAELEQAIDFISEQGEFFVDLMSGMIQLCVRLNDKEQAAELLDEYSERIVAAVQNHHFDYLQYLIAVAPLNDEALTAAKQLARAFDERNGNRYYQNQLALMFLSPENQAIH